MKEFKIYIITASLLLVVYLVAQYNKPSPINWKPTLYYQDKIPFGTYIFYNQLPHIFPGAKIDRTNNSIYELLHDEPSVGTNYFVISNAIDINKADFKAMTDFIKRGNSVFLATSNWKGIITDSLNIETESTYQLKTKNSVLNFTNARLKKPSGYRFDNGVSNQYFSSFDTAHAVVLSQNADGKSTYLSFKYGAGRLFLCANPQVFSNVSLLSHDGAAYAANVLSYLPASKQIYWDQFQNGDIPQDVSPVRIILDHPDLRWAYYISIASLLIFVLYEMKRRQRIIPVIEPLANSTLAFVNIVGQVYYRQRDNANIAAKKILYFLEHIRTAFFIKTTKLDRDFADVLIRKTGVEPALAKELIDHINYLSVQSKVSDNELILLNQMIEKFYSQTA